ncbi:dimeric dUTPase (all-alpha-NTP-PPase superfamily) [Lysinibacillus composti]|uniref:dUTP diphosphatase n=1 Tax=Lysinibacillus composti TaxID=720633 RepID=UPI0026A889E6|nr:dimeric dUTPase (all-alpha-NTP-PPase superfamily) [Lysinibacillus composti]
MNLTKLFEIQAGLDYHITKEHPEQNDENRLSKKVLALQVELGECANEWRGFKFWSNDQVARENLLLEEYVDCLHFLLSIGNTLNFRYLLPYKKPLETDVVDLFNLIFEHISFFTRQRVSKSRILLNGFQGIHRIR